MEYYILADSDNVEPFTTPRQLTKINGETLIERTIRLLKENGIENIYVTSHDKRFDNLGAIRYEPKYNTYKPKKNEGYWVEAFPIELLDRPITFLLGDVYYSENAIKTIVNTTTNYIMYFCSYKNEDNRYIKHHDEPFAFKVIDYVMFKEHIQRMKDFKDSGKALREPIAWELYRSLNNIPITTHKIGDNCVIINDETCDIDRVEDVALLENTITNNNSMIKVKVIINTFTFKDFDKLIGITRANTYGNEIGRLYEGDTFKCDKSTAKYLLGENDLKKCVVEVIEILPIKKDQ